MGSWCDFVWAPPVLKLSWATGRGKTRETLKLCCLEFLAPLIMHEMCIRVISQGFILYKLLHVVWDIKCCSLNQQYHLLVNPGTVNFWSSNISKTGCCFLVNQPTPCFVSKLAKTDTAIDMHLWFVQSESDQGGTAFYLRMSCGMKLTKGEDTWPNFETAISVIKKITKSNQILLFYCCRPRRMSGSLSGRSWPWAVSSMMGRASTPAVARVANPVCPQGNTADISRISMWLTLGKCLIVCVRFVVRLFVVLFWSVCVEGRVLCGHIIL